MLPGLFFNVNGQESPFRLTPVREGHPAFPCNTGPLPRPNHPFKVPCGWLGRGSGPVLQSPLRMQRAHPTRTP